MATQAQINANHANSQKSIGPATPEGKAKSSINRLSHGFASNTRFIKGEDPEEFYALLNDLILEHQPATPTQQILVEKMAHNQWISLRSIRIQADILRIVHMGGVPNSLGLLIRYQTTADRAFHKAYADLLKSKKERGNSKIGFEPQNAVEPVAPPVEPIEKPSPIIPKPVPHPPAEPGFPSLEEELNWVMNAGLEEMRATAL